MSRLSLLSRILSNRGWHSFLWLASEKALQLVFAAVSVGLIARTLGASQFGELQYALSVLSVFSAVVLIGNNETAAPVLYEQRTQSDRRLFLGSLFCLRALAGFVAFLGMAVWTTLLEPGSRQMVLFVLAISLLISEPFNILRVIRETKQDTRIITLTRLGVSCVRVLAVWMLYKLDGSIILFAAVYSADYLAVAIVYLMAIRDDGFPWQWRISCHWIKQLIKNGSLVWLGLLAMILTQRLDRILLEDRLPNLEYGHYTAALSLLDSAWFFGPIAVAALAPSMVYRTGKSSKRTSLFIISIVMIGVFLSAAISIAAPLVVQLVFGENYADSAVMLQVGSLVLVPAFGALAMNAILIKAGRHEIVTLQWLISLLVTCMLLLIPIQASWVLGPVALGCGYLSCLLFGLWSIQKWPVSNSA